MRQSRRPGGRRDDGATARTRGLRVVARCLEPHLGCLRSRDRSAVGSGRRGSHRARTTDGRRARPRPWNRDRCDRRAGGRAGWQKRPGRRSRHQPGDARPGAHENASSKPRQRRATRGEGGGPSCRRRRVRRRAVLPRPHVRDRPSGCCPGDRLDPQVVAPLHDRASSPVHSVHRAGEAGRDHALKWRRAARFQPLSSALA